MVQGKTAVVAAAERKRAKNQLKQLSAAAFPLLSLDTFSCFFFVQRLMFDGIRRIALDAGGCWVLNSGFLRFLIKLI